MQNSPFPASPGTVCVFEGLVEVQVNSSADSPKKTTLYFTILKQAESHGQNPTPTVLSKDPAILLAIGLRAPLYASYQASVGHLWGLSRSNLAFWRHFPCEGHFGVSGSDRHDQRSFFSSNTPIFIEFRAKLPLFRCLQAPSGGTTSTAPVKVPRPTTFQCHVAENETVAQTDGPFRNRATAPGLIAGTLPHFDRLFNVSTSVPEIARRMHRSPRAAHHTEHSPVLY